MEEGKATGGDSPLLGVRVSEDLIAEGRRLIAAATPGPLRANLYLGGAYVIERVRPNGGRVARLDVVDGLLETKANADRFVFAVNNLAALLDVAEAAERLVRALDTVHNDPAYRGVWAMHFAHGGEYNGPTYTFEHDALRAALALGQDGEGKEKSNG